MASECKTPPGLGPRAGPGVSPLVLGGRSARVCWVLRGKHSLGNTPHLEGAGALRPALPSRRLTGAPAVACHQPAASHQAAAFTYSRTQRHRDGETGVGRDTETGRDIGTQRQGRRCPPRAGPQCPSRSVLITKTPEMTPAPDGGFVERPEVPSPALGFPG